MPSFNNGQLKVAMASSQSKRNDQPLSRASIDNMIGALKHAMIKKHDTTVLFSFLGYFISEANSKKIKQMVEDHGEGHTRMCAWTDDLILIQTAWNVVTVKLIGGTDKLSPNSGVKKPAPAPVPAPAPKKAKAAALAALGHADDHSEEDEDGGFGLTQETSDIDIATRMALALSKK